MTRRPPHHPPPFDVPEEPLTYEPDTKRHGNRIWLFCQALGFIALAGLAGWALVLLAMAGGCTGVMP